MHFTHFCVKLAATEHVLCSEPVIAAKMDFDVLHCVCIGKRALRDIDGMGHGVVHR